MYIAYISLLLICFSPLCWWLTKRRRMILSLYMHIWVYAFYVFTKWGEWFRKFIQKGGESLYMYIWVFAYIEFMHFMFIQKGREGFWKFKPKGGEGFWEKNFLFMHVSLTLFMHIYLFSLCTSLNIYLFIVMHELRGSFYEA